MRSKQPVESVYPQAFKAHAIKDGTYVDEVTWVSTCPVQGCQYGVALDDLQIAADAVNGHIRRVHDYEASRADASMPPVALLTAALDQFADGRAGEALAMVHEARDRMLEWVVQ